MTIHTLPVVKIHPVSTLCEEEILQVARNQIHDFQRARYPNCDWYEIKYPYAAVHFWK